MDITKRELVDKLELLSVFTLQVPGESHPHYVIQEHLVDRHAEIPFDAFLTLNSAQTEAHEHFIQSRLQAVSYLSQTRWQRWRCRQQIIAFTQDAEMSVDEFVTEHAVITGIGDALDVPAILSRDASLYLLHCANPVRALCVQLSQVAILGVSVQGVDADTDEVMVKYNTRYGEMVPAGPPEAGEVPTGQYYYRWFLCQDRARQVATQLCQSVSISESVTSQSTDVDMDGVKLMS